MGERSYGELTQLRNHRELSSDLSVSPLAELGRQSRLSVTDPPTSLPILPTLAFEGWSGRIDFESFSPSRAQDADGAETLKLSKEILPGTERASLRALADSTNFDRPSPVLRQKPVSRRSR